MSGDPNKVNATGVQYDAMSSRWELLLALMGGTQAMRDGAETWLPRMAGEKKEDYEARLDSSFLFPGYRDGIRQIVSRPFSRDVSIAEDAPDWVMETSSDVDKLGRSLTSFARDVFRDGIDRGKSHILVDADPNADGPHFVHVNAASLIGWQVDTRHQLTQIRILETAVVPEGAYGDRAVLRVRVYEPSMWRLYEQQRETELWEQVDEGAVSLGKIPLVTYYTARTGFLTAEPPLEDLAWANLDHWQSYSDQRNILRFSRFAMRYVLGLSREELDAIGPRGATTEIVTDNPDAKVGYAEPSGKAIGAGREHLKDLEAAMQMMAMRPLVERSGNTTATEKAINEARNDTDVQAWIGGLESAIVEAYELAAEWRGQELPDEFGVEISSEFSLGAADSSILDALHKARALREIDSATYLQELRRRDVLHEGTDIDLVMESVESEPLPGLGGGDNAA